LKNKNNLIIVVGVIVITIMLSLNYLKTDIWDSNAKKLSNAFNIISGDARIDNLSQFTPFEWDTLYSFDPYTSKDEIYKTIGYKWDQISETVNENMNQIVFMKDRKVVCYVFGYPEYNKIGFDFGEYDGSYIKLLSEDKLTFDTTVTEDGIRLFNYIK
jgi:hypothetical protein